MLRLSTASTRLSMWSNHRGPERTQKSQIPHPLRSYSSATSRAARWTTKARPTPQARSLYRSRLPQCSARHRRAAPPAGHRRLNTRPRYRREKQLQTTARIESCARSAFALPCHSKVPLGAPSQKAAQKFPKTFMQCCSPLTGRSFERSERLLEGRNVDDHQLGVRLADTVVAREIDPAEVMVWHGLRLIPRFS